MNETNRQELLSEAERLGVPLNQVGTPFIIVQHTDGTESTLLGEAEAIDHFTELEEQIKLLSAE
ncbi:MAG: hypothetical protein LBO09_09095 [Candidatus Peribacteria bacterium]|jgi:hypothetical protein|nr:hypothetical protein [Candidatus Peribacteria bacterium]